jgi:hypothetical protein
MQVYFKNNYVTILYDKQTQLGKAEWRGQLRGPELREAYLLILDLIDRFSLIRWLADDRYMGAVEPADLQWSLQEYIPRIAKSPLRRMARLPSIFEENLQAIGVMINKGHTYDLNLIFRDFTNEAEAKAWLMEPL